MQRHFSIMESVFDAASRYPFPHIPPVARGEPYPWYNLMSLLIRTYFASFFEGTVIKID
jgi:hypothetical protein